MYDAFFDRVLTRTDAERAHHTAFRAIRAARPLTRPALRSAVGHSCLAPAGQLPGLERSG